MVWDERWPAVARTWGLGVGLLVGVCLAIAVAVVGDVVVELPSLRDQVRIIHVFPGLAAVVLPFRLLDRTPDLTVLSTAPPERVFVLRLVGALIATVPLILALRAAGWSSAAALVVPAFVGLGALACVTLGSWYWAPMLFVMVLWLQWGSRDWPYTAPDSLILLDLLVVAGGGAAYVIGESQRLRRRQRSRTTR
ncbi:hypothetical protein [Nocardioides sp. Root190]|uniref:hypothetical protein n=1 Tax=Nocardioides sp. Root190 TaxID=1736488 RepID=UPI0012FCFDBD|nr:hypothetical protein [Nocardioides sp. Root190]